MFLNTQNVLQISMVVAFVLGVVLYLTSRQMAQNLKGCNNSTVEANLLHLSNLSVVLMVASASFFVCNRTCKNLNDIQLGLHYYVVFCGILSVALLIITTNIQSGSGTLCEGNGGLAAFVYIIATLMLLGSIGYFAYEFNLKRK